MKNLSKQKNQTGVSLVQALVAMSILLIVSLGFSKIVVDGMRGQKTLQIKSDLRNMRNYLELIASRNESCTRSFGGSELPPTPADRSSLVIKNPADGAAVLVQPNQLFEGFEIEKVELVGREELAPFHYITKLVIKPKLPGIQSTIGSLENETVEIRLLVQTEPTNPNQIVGCGGESSILYSCVMQGGAMLKSGPSSVHQRCYYKGDLSGNVVWTQELSTGNTVQCQYPNAHQAATDLSQETPSYCGTGNLPCCRPGFKRTRLGAIEWAATNRRETTFSCFYVGGNFCHQPGDNGCECN